MGGECARSCKLLESEWGYDYDARDSDACRTKNDNTAAHVWRFARSAVVDGVLVGCPNTPVRSRRSGLVLAC